jgi:peptidyl-prolyl cis-trans isomerase C
MKSSFLARSVMSLTLCAAAATPLAAYAQNVAIVNGKAVPKARVDALIKQVQAQAAAQSQQLPPDLEQRVRDKVVMDEIFTQEAEKRGLAASAEYRLQMEQARQAVLTKLLTQDFAKKHAVSDDDVKADYEKFKAQSAGTEYRARHILVEKEDEAKALIAQINGGASFEELAKKNSKDPGSGANGGDLDFAAPGSYVPEFSQAMVKLKKGEMTQEPVKSQFGYHIIRLDDTRPAQFPPFDDVKGQLKQRMEQQQIGAFVEEIRAKAKTDYKFSN